MDSGGEDFQMEGIGKLINLSGLLCFPVDNHILYCQLWHAKIEILFDEICPDIRVGMKEKT